MIKRLKTIEDKNSNAHKGFIISILGPKRFYWDMIVILFSVINAIILPLQFAFFEASETEVPAIQLLDKITLSVFVADMVVNTFTSYVDLKSSEEVTDLKLVVKNYVLSELFVVDFLSTFPFRQVFTFMESENFTVFVTFLGLFKMQRLQRIGTQIRHLSVRNETKALLKIVKMVFFLCLYIHIVGCLWRFILGKDFIWVKESDFMYGESKLKYETMFNIYTSMLYHAVMIFNLNEIAPMMEEQIVFAIVFMVISALTNSFIFGELASLIS